MPGGIRVERRLGNPRWVAFVVPVVALIVAAIVTAAVLAASGHQPLQVYQQIYQAGFTANGALSRTFVYATPLLFTGLAAAVAFRMKVWNIGGEGQLYAGAIGAAGVGLALHTWPGPLVIIAMVIGGALAGALWAAIPGLLRAYLRTNEILTSLMLNYVAGLLLYYLIYDSTSYWRDMTSASAKVFPTGKSIEASAFWPQLSFGAALVVPMGFGLGIVVALGIWTVTRTSPTGFAMSVIGESPGAATYAGMRTKRTIAGVMLASGAFAGIGGASQIGDFGHTLDPRGLQQAGYGYTGIVVAALGRYNPLAVVIVSFLIGALTNAGFALQGPDFPSGLVGVIEGIILFSVLAGEALSRYRISLRRSPRTADTAPGTPVGEVVAP